MVYRLDAIDAYNQHLVKKIEVKGISQKGSTATNGYLYLEEIVLSKGNPQARICFDTKTANGTKQTTKLVNEGFNLYEQSGELAEYKDGYIIERIDGMDGSIHLLNGIQLSEGDAIGKVNEDLLRRIQIRETIRTHIERERQLFQKNIKVLSLFFIDHVDSYRLYGDKVETDYNKMKKLLQLGKLVEATGLTRRTIVSILQGIKPDTFLQFRLNPEEFIIKVARIINDCKATAVVQHITYNKREGDNGTYSTDIFSESILKGKLGINAIESKKSLYDLVVVDSTGIEMSFAEKQEKQEEVEVYTKLPRGFYINTPMGRYNPDWAVVFREGTVKHIYFIAETKGEDLLESDLRTTEQNKIACARKHFEAISHGDVIYDVVKTYDSLYNKVMK